MSRAETQAEGRPTAVFAALGNRTRLALVTRLSDGTPRSIARLSADAGITRQAVTKHLLVLEKAGLVASRRCGRESVYGLRPEPLTQARSYLDEVSAQWDDALERLRVFVEEQRGP